jgi:DNA-3-methyladenine glycosylase II
MSDTHTAVLTAVPPFDLACTVRAIEGFSPCRGDQAVEGGTVRKALLHPADPLRAVVAEVGPPPDGVCGVLLTVHADEPLSGPELSRVAQSVDRWLGLSEDRAEFLAAAGADPGMAALLEVAAGLHQVRFPTLAEGATYFTLTHRTAEQVAGSRKRRLAAAHGPRACLDGVEFVAFPAMSVLQELSDTELASYAGGWARGNRLRDVLAGVGAMDEEWLRTAPYAEARKALLAVAGVGPFTSYALLFRVLGRPDDVPLEMAQFARLGEAVYGDSAPTAADLRERYGTTIAWWSYLVRTALDWTRPAPSNPAVSASAPAPSKPAVGASESAPGKPAVSGPVSAPSKPAISGPVSAPSKPALSGSVPATAARPVGSGARRRAA